MDGRRAMVYSDADIEQRELGAFGSELTAGAASATRIPTADDLQQVEDAAYHACWFFNPVYPAVVQVCADLGIDPTSDAVMSAMFRGSDRAKEADNE
ncbi:MAG: hypothetical protein DWQ20_06100 [Actinobacteria bacterium]|nr:MAG: hypothetical protein DWQ20_06100 [Actinomycetota bacterium]